MSKSYINSDSRFPGTLWYIKSLICKKKIPLFHKFHATNSGKQNLYPGIHKNRKGWGGVGGTGKVFKSTLFLRLAVLLNHTWKYG